MRRPAYQRSGACRRPKRSALGVDAGSQRRVRDPPTHESNGAGLEAVAEKLLERHDGLGEALDALGQLVVRHPVLEVHAAERSLVDEDALDRRGPRALGVELARELALRLRELL